MNYSNEDLIKIYNEHKDKLIKDKKFILPVELEGCYYEVDECGDIIFCGFDVESIYYNNYMTHDFNGLVLTIPNYFDKISRLVFDKYAYRNFKNSNSYEALNNHSNVLGTRRLVLGDKVRVLLPYSFASSDIDYIDLCKVEEICEHCFEYSLLKEIKSDYVVKVGYSSFMDCLDLVSIEFPKLDYLDDIFAINDSKSSRLLMFESLTLGCDLKDVENDYLVKVPNLEKLISVNIDD